MAFGHPIVAGFVEASQRARPPLRDGAQNLETKCNVMGTRHTASNKQRVHIAREAGSFGLGEIEVIQ